MIAVYRRQHELEPGLRRTVAEVLSYARHKHILRLIESRTEVGEQCSRTEYVHRVKTYQAKIAGPPGGTGVGLEYPQVAGCP